MRKAILRALCAFLLMGIALSVTVGIFAAPKEEPVYVWMSVTFAAEEPIKLYDAEGKLLQTLQPSDGYAVSKLLPEGRFYAFADELCAEFTLNTEQGVTLEGGCGWTDGRVLHLTSEKVGAVRVDFSAQDAYYTFTLVGDRTSKRETVRGYAGQTVCCEFFGVSYGTYDLYLGEEAIAQVRVSDEAPTVVVALPY